MAFSGFSIKTLDFLAENRVRDSREWFHAHHDLYKKHVLSPFTALCEALAPSLLDIDGGMVTRPQSVLSRINRDIRFSKDKSLYRDHLWMTFACEKTDPGCPAYWFEVSQRGFSCGAGFYSAPPALMERYRRVILAGHPLFLKAQKAFRRQSVFTIEGEMYKKPRVPERPELREWLDRKNLYFAHEETGHETVFSSGLPETISEFFRLLRPEYDFLKEIYLQYGGGDRP